MKIEIEIPDGATVGDLTTSCGAISKAAAEFVDWEKMQDVGDDIDEAISVPGRILLRIATELTRKREPS